MARTSHRRFHSAEEFEKGIAGLIDGECTQSTAGPTDVTLATRHASGCIVHGCHSTQQMLLRGSRSPDFWTLSPVGKAAQGGRFHGRSMTSSDLVMLNPGGEAYQQVFPGQSQLAVAVPVAFAEKILEVEHRRSANSLLNEWRVKTDPDVTNRLEKLLQQILGQQDAALDLSAPENLASRILALAMRGRQAAPARVNVIHRRRVVARAEELIRSRLHAPPSVMALCEATNTSRRALFYAFESLLGRSPIQHANILRLHAARRRIIESGSGDTVRSVAEALGFWHPGQFSADYRRLFGELPSETKKLGASPKRAGRKYAAPKPDSRHPEILEAAVGARLVPGC